MDGHLPVLPFSLLFPGLPGRGIQGESFPSPGASRDRRMELRLKERSMDADLRSSSMCSGCPFSRS